MTRLTITLQGWLNISHLFTPEEKSIIKNLALHNPLRELMIIEMDDLNNELKEKLFAMLFKINPDFEKI